MKFRLRIIMNHNIEKSLVQIIWRLKRTVGKIITVFQWRKRTQTGPELGFYFIHLNEKERSGSHSHHNESNDLKNIILIDIVPCTLDPSHKWDISNNINMHISLKYKTKKHRIQSYYLE